MVRWLASRVLVAMLASGIVGLAFGLVMAISVITTDHLSVSEYGGPLAMGAIGFAVGGVLGLPSSLLIVFATRARLQPWRAFPRLAAGGIAGFFAAFGIGALPLGEWYSFMDYKGPGPMPMVALWIALSTLGAFVASRTLPRGTGK